MSKTLSAFSIAVELDEGGCRVDQGGNSPSPRYTAIIDAVNAEVDGHAFRDLDGGNRGDHRQKN